MNKKLTDLFTPETFQETLGRPLTEGDIWYLVDSRWFKQCRKYLGFNERLRTAGAGPETEEAHPGLIDNSHLMDPSAPCELKDNMRKGLNYDLVPPDIWFPLQEQFGLVEGQEPIPRIVRKYGLFGGLCWVEVYLTEFCLALNSDPENKIKHKFSKADGLVYVMKKIRRVFNVPETAECRMWAKYISCYKLIDELSAFLECGLYLGQTLILEVRGEDGDWSRDNISPRSMEDKTSIPMNCKGCKEKDELLEVMERLWSEDVRSMSCKACKEKDELLEVMERLWSKDFRRKEDLEENSFCKICMEAPIDCVILECGHMCTCTNCGKQMKECPICRQEVVRVVRTFKA